MFSLSPFQVQFLKHFSTTIPRVFSVAHWASRFRSFESCDYFMIPFTSQNVKCDNLAELMHELSNQGARDEFNQLLEEQSFGSQDEQPSQFSQPSYRVNSGASSFAYDRPLVHSQSTFLRSYIRPVVRPIVSLFKSI